MSLKLSTTAFSPGGTIPRKYSKDGGNISPALFWSGVPSGAKSLALIVDDPDAPKGVFVHWVLYAVSPAASSLEEHLTASATLPDGARQGMNGFDEVGYGGPQPPSGVHRYFFRLYALDTELGLEPKASREALDGAMRGHILKSSEIFGTYRHEGSGSEAA